MKRNLISVLTAAVLLAILVLYMIAFQVRESEKAFVTRFGEIVRSKTDAGLYWKWPWPMEKVYRFDGRIRVFAGTLQETLTRDNKNLVVTVATGWSIDEPKLFYESLGTPENAQRQMEATVRNYKNQVIGRHDLSHFVSSNREDLEFEEIEEEIATLLAQIAESQFGIKVHFVRLTQLGLPEQVTAHVFERMRAERNRLTEQILAQGDRRAKEIRAKADSERKQILARAEAEALRIRSEGDAAAAAYYDTFKEHPELTIFLAELEALAKMKNRTTVVLDLKSPPFNLLLGSPPAAKTKKEQ